MKRYMFKNTNHRMLLYLTFLLFFSFFGIFVNPANIYSATYYVAKNGNDNNSGNEAFPWLTIQKAADTMIAGDLIKVGSNNPVRVVSVNYDTNTITVNKNISWNIGDNVSYPYSNSAPDIGAYEY